MAAAMNSDRPVDQTAPKTSLVDKGHMTPFAAGQLEIDNGCLCCYEEPRGTRIRQLRTRVVPPKPRRVATAACHASPFGGHSGTNRTYCQVITRCWWPTVKRDVNALVQACAHCQPGNASSHKAQQMLHFVESDGPFDVMFMDFWKPGDMPDKGGARSLLTCLCELSGFGAAQHLNEKAPTAQSTAQMAFDLFTMYGLP